MDENLQNNFGEDIPSSSSDEVNEQSSFTLQDDDIPVSKPVVSENTSFYDAYVPPKTDYSKTEYSYIPPKEPKQEEKKKSGFSKIVLTAVISAVIAGVIGASTGAVFATVRYNSLQGNNNSTNNITSDSGSTSTTHISINETVDSVIEAVAQKVTPSVVGIATSASTSNFLGGSSETTGEGSGIIYTADGYIITNYHVIESVIKSSSSKIDVYLSTSTEKSYPASIVGYNISYDLAVIKISTDTTLPAIEFADMSNVKVGQFVAAIGSPGGLEFMGSVTYGIVSGLNRVISDSSTGSDVKLIQTDAAINPGNSGGALVNTTGQLVGVNSSKIASTDYEGMGFAIPADTVKEICDKIIAKENDPNPYIGITISERYDADTLTELGYPAGAVVSSVISSGPAAQSGIRSGDIIVEFNGVAITEYSQLSEEVSKCAVGNNVTVKIYRSGRYYSTSIKVGSNNSQ